MLLFLCFCKIDFVDSLCLYSPSICCVFFCGCLASGNNEGNMQNINKLRNSMKCRLVEIISTEKFQNQRVDEKVFIATLVLTDRLSAEDEVA